MNSHKKLWRFTNSSGFSLHKHFTQSEAEIYARRTLCEMKESKCPPLAKCYICGIGDPEPTAAWLMHLLSERYRKDKYIFVPELNDGCNIKGARRIDGLAYKLGLDTHIHALEIKVSKSDFLSEMKSEKYKAWLNHVDYFSFVTPKGLLKKEEVPDGCGLIEAYVNLSGLRATKKAPKLHPQYDHFGSTQLYEQLLNKIGYTLAKARISTAQECARREYD